MMSSKVLLVGSLFALLSAETPLRLFEAVEPHMGTLFRIKLYAENEVQAQVAFRIAFQRIRQLDEILSDYRVDSELTRLTQDAVRHPVLVSKDLFIVLWAAQKTAEHTDGAFDVTLGPLTQLWRSARKLGIPPDAASVQSALARSGYQKMHMDVGARSVELDAVDMQLDAGGIAKGYAADQAISGLRAAGITRALVAASGDLAFSDAPPGKPGWDIGIDSHDGAGQAFTRVLSLANAAVSTSGDSEQHLDANGKRYSHVIDPKMGSALTDQLTVTVVAPTGIEADSAATALSVLGKEKGLAAVEHWPRMAALFVDPVSVTASRRFDRLVGLRKSRQALP